MVRRVLHLNHQHKVGVPDRGRRTRQLVRIRRICLPRRSLGGVSVPAHLLVQERGRQRQRTRLDRLNRSARISTAAVSPAEHGCCDGTAWRPLGQVTRADAPQRRHERPNLHRRRIVREDCRSGAGTNSDRDSERACHGDDSPTAHAIAACNSDDDPRRRRHVNAPHGGDVDAAHTHNGCHRHHCDARPRAAS